MESNSDKVQTPSEVESSKLITALTEFIPTFFSANGVLSKDLADNSKLNIRELLEQSESFFQDHPNSFSTDDSKNSFVISKLYGPPKKWGLSLKVDGTLNSLGYKTFKELLINNFGDTKELKYVLIEQLLNLKQHHFGKAALFTIEFRRLAGRIGWPDDVFIDLIRRGLLEEVKKEFDKLDKPKTLFDATNAIISIDKKCILEQKTKFNKAKDNNGSTFKRRRHELNKI